MVKIRVCFRLDAPLYYDIKEQAERMKWTLSKTIRYLIKVSYPCLTTVKISKKEILDFLEKEGDYIEVWKIIGLIAPRAIEEIEKLTQK